MTKVTKDHCLEIINKFEPCSENQKQGVLGIDGESTLQFCTIKLFNTASLF